MDEWFSDVILKLVKFNNLSVDKSKDFTEKNIYYVIFILAEINII